MANETTAKRTIQDEGLLTTKEAASFLRIGLRTIQEHTEARRIPVIRIGRSVRYSIADLREFVEANRIKAKGWKGGN